MDIGNYFKISEDGSRNNGVGRKRRRSSEGPSPASSSSQSSLSSLPTLLLATSGNSSGHTTLERRATATESSPLLEHLVFALKNFCAGTVAGVMECLVGHPLDTLKVRMQTIAASSSGANTAATSINVGVIALMKATIKNEGFLALYRGASSRVVGSAIGNSVLFGTNGEFKTLFNADSSRPLSFRFLLAAGFTGLAEALVFTPIDLIKTRCQVQYGREVSLTPWKVTKMLIKEHGFVKGLYSGAGPTMTRDFFGNMAYFSVYETMKRRLIRWRGLRREGDTLTYILAGGTAGMSYWALILPVDTIKSIVQSQERSRTGSAFQVAVGLYHQGGVPSFYRGLTPALLRAFPTSAATFVTFEWTLSLLNRLC